MNNIPQAEQSKSETLKKKPVLVFGAFGLSIVGHVVLVLLVGGIVIIQGIVPKSNFETDPGILASEEPAAPEELPEQDAMPEDVQSVESVATAPEVGAAIDVVVMDTPDLTSNFSTPSTVSNAMKGPVGSGAFALGNKSPGRSGARGMGSVFGEKGGKDGLVGFFYDLKQDKNRKPTAMAGTSDEDPRVYKQEDKEYREVLRKFLKEWDNKILEGYYKAPESMTIFQFFIPKMNANEAPNAFGVGSFVRPRRWAIHYKGTVTAPETAKIRFVGVGDDILVVRFNNKIVLDGSLGACGEWSNDRKERVGTIAGRDGQPLFAGDWINIKAGQSYPMEVLVGEQPGGAFYSFLYVQEDGKRYAGRPGNGLRLPLFQTISTKIPEHEAESDAPTTAGAYIFQKAE